MQNSAWLGGFRFSFATGEESVSSAATEDEDILDSPLMETATKKLLLNSAGTNFSIDELSLADDIISDRGSVSRKSFRRASLDCVAGLHDGRVFSPRISAARKQVRRYSLDVEDIFLLSEGTSKVSFQPLMPRSRKVVHQNAMDVPSLKKTPTTSSQSPMPRSQRSTRKVKKQRRAKSDTPKTLSPPIKNTHARRSKSDNPETLLSAEVRRPNRQAHLGRRRVKSPFGWKSPFGSSKATRRSNTSYQPVLPTSSSQSSLLTQPPRRGTRRSSASPTRSGSSNSSLSLTPGRNPNPEPSSPSTCATENTSASSIATPLFDTSEGKSYLTARKINWQ